MTFIKCGINVAVTSWRCIDVKATLYRLHWLSRRYIPVNALLYLRGLNAIIFVCIFSPFSARQTTIWLHVCIQDCTFIPFRKSGLLFNRNALLPVGAIVFLFRMCPILKVMKKKKKKKKKKKHWQSCLPWKCTQPTYSLLFLCRDGNIYTVKRQWDHENLFWTWVATKG